MESDIITFLVVIGGVCSFVGLLVTIALSHRRQLETLRSEREIQTKLIEKLSSGNDFHAFLEADGLAVIAGAMRPRADSTYYQLITIVMAGCVATVVGSALFVLAEVHDSAATVRQTLFLLATILLASGIGMLLAGAIGRALVRRLADPSIETRK